MNGRQELVRKTRKYIAETPIEGCRLLLRVNGLHHATVTRTPGGLMVDVPPVPAEDVE
ncbi:hypothetical protein V5F53_18615 [Xanthobacter sp. V4C-4]|uniref:hypothetical protein n=1 Tax=Xanthobacter cornucopiae TaxID=3119924 RepID=UPI00372B1A64